ncbi:MAG: hypothetical protein A2Y14_02840 [Verrucomicrobia bacterium GWF2_51_19]|nr:MAG: hypothetical protein A2Y14_02840 [Verrucomicrobia bacterium GWF2_51_19]HCJ11834.1 hypothetical protein [Opitutae bacterium]
MHAPNASVYGYECIEADRIEKFKNEAIFAQEMALAQSFVEQFPSTPSKPHCPITHSADVRPLFTKWGIPYFLCEASWTLFADVESGHVERFQRESEVSQFRLSSEYQADASLRRDTLWNRTLDWIAYKSFRYLAKNKGLSVIDFGNRYVGFVEKLQGANFCGQYNADNADICLSLDHFQSQTDPVRYVQKLYKSLKPGGILFLSTRAATGFDVLMLCEDSTLFPYEHIVLPSRQSLAFLLEQAGFQILETHTPGIMDVTYVRDHMRLEYETPPFLRCLLQTLSPRGSIELQQFLQKHGYSSYMQIIAKKE